MNSDAGTPAPTQVATAGSPLVFNLIWDTSVTSAPSAFKTDVIAAAQYLEREVANAVTLNVDVGYNEIGGNPLGFNGLGQNQSARVAVSYNDLVTALGNTDFPDVTDQSVLASLPPASPVSGTWYVTLAQAKALGLAPPGGTAVDGDVGFALASQFTYGLTNTSGTVAAGTYDMFGSAVHELTEVMGRSLLTGSTNAGPSPAFSLLDLLHWSAPGTRDFSAAAPGYFSVDGGVTDLGEFNTVPSGDAGDWAASVTANSFDAFGTPGQLHTVDGDDLAELDAIGWNLTSASPPARTLDWTGTNGGDFSNPANWNDTTNGLDPAVVAPGTLDVASIINGGSITGAGTVYQLNFAGANSVAGVLTALDQSSDDGGPLAVTGTLTAAGMNLAGDLSATAGGRVTSNGAVYLLAGAMIATDGLSSIEVGTAGTAAPGSITVDAAEGGISGDGTLAAPLVNNGMITAYRAIAGGNTLEITGAVTGSGTIGLQTGSNTGTGAALFGAILQLDSSISSSQIIAFGSAAAAGNGATLRLANPMEFAGTLSNFADAGDILVLVGETITGAVVNNSTLTVTRTAGAPLNVRLRQSFLQTNELSVSGSEIIVLPARTLDWTGAGGTDFANPVNWNDTTDGLDPAVVAPGTLDVASIMNGGSISGSGTAYQLWFGGTNTVAGALTGVNLVDAGAGSLTVTGTVNAPGGLNEQAGSMTVTGLATADGITVLSTLSAVSGGRITSSGSLALSAIGSDPEIFVDGLSSVEIGSGVEVGTGGSAHPGAITVDTGSTITGDGKLDAAVVNNGSITAETGLGATGESTTLEITGAVTGAGRLNLASGPGALFAPGVPGATLRLDSSVANSQTIAFATSPDQSSAPVLLLADPSEFDGTLDAFDDAGDTLALAGETITAASISGSTLTVSVASGPDLTFSLLNTPASTPLLVSDGQLSVNVVPRTLVWAGITGFSIEPGAFDYAANWNDPADGLSPAATPPDGADTAEFLTGGGSITGTGTAASLEFGGPAQWLLNSSSTLSATGTAGVVVGEGGSGALTLSGGATIISLGSTDVVSGTSGQAGSVTVEDAGSTWSSTGELLIGDSGPGELTIQASGTVLAGAGAVIANTGAASGSSIDMSGAGSRLVVPDLLDVGATGSGSLQIDDGATVIAGSLDAGNVAAAVGQIGLSGIGSGLVVAGSATVGDDGTGVLSVLSGATFAAADLTVGSSGDSSGALVVSGDGSVVRISGDLNIGTALGTGDLTVGPGAAVHASVVNLQGQVVLEGGLLDPDVEVIDQGQTAGGFGTIVADDIVDEGVIEAGAGQSLLVQGTVLGGGTLTVNGTRPRSNPSGALQIGAGGTLELTGAVLSVATTTFTDNLTPIGTYTVNNSVVDVTFADSAGVLKLDDIAGFGGTITTYQAGDTFVIPGGALSGLNVGNGNTLMVSDSGGTDRIIFGPAISAAEFDIVNGDTIQVACLAAGTRIETPHGPVAVETLIVGDEVLTLLGGPGSIVWIGSRSVDCARHPRPQAVWPVRISRDAFGENMPSRDLFVSPDHAIYVDGVLIPVKYLLNGATVRQVKRRRVTYYHFELAQHDVVLAEGLPVETYLDGGDRTMFLGGHVSVLYLDFSARRWEMAGCAELLMTGARLDAVRQRVDERAGAARRPLTSAGRPGCGHRERKYSRPSAAAASGVGEM